MSEKTIDQLLAEANQALEAEKAAHEATKAAFEDYKIEAEARILKERSRNPKKIVEVEHEGKKYIFNQPKVNRKGTIISAEEASEDVEFISSILAIEGQNIIKEDN